MARPKRSPGRPAILQSPEVTGVNLTAKERRIIAGEQRRALEHHDKKPSMNEVIRRAVRQLDSQALQAELRHEEEKRELRRRLDQAERRELELRERAAKRETQVQKAGGALVDLLQMLPQVKEWAASRRALPSGNKLLDQIWHNRCQNSWRLVEAYLEKLHRDRGGADPPPPPDKAGAA